MLLIERGSNQSSDNDMFPCSMGSNMLSTKEAKLP